MPCSSIAQIEAYKKTLSPCSIEENAGRFAAEPDLTIVDVGEAAELQGGSVPSAVNIPRGSLEIEVVDGLLEERSTALG